ncbi:MAG: cAMP/cGMP-dependent 3',5'-cyclic-AMP/GMP phosphodiesterase [Erysipelotrichia bacterium]|nr:cAMP/cGMP-dependent 3',5'-cyclic-AMP/GMP phosphodiesterase [Erysipelotrichia bacterium]
MSVEIIQLARGGTLIKTPSGSLQVGAPPETIKDTMRILGDVPDTFVIPNRVFSAERGVSLADIEFPAYYNFFIKRRPIRVIGHRHQLETILCVLRESVLGPDDIQLTREYPYGINRELIPNLRAEMEFFRPFSLSGKRKAELADMAIGVQWGPENRVPFGDMALERTKDCLRVVDGKNVLAEVSLDVAFGGTPDKLSPPRPFEPPLFGVTVIGSGSGFDPGEMTSGFIVWVNRRGILVDPPVDSTHWLRSMDINPRLIDDCILTHCHADHDSGILQKLLEEKKINLYTTETIMESFVRKYQSLTGLNYKTFMSLFHFHPISLQVPIRINGGEFRFFYTLHSIPTVGFEVYFQGKSFVYSSDSLYDPETFKKLYERGDVNRYRMIELTNFPWHHSVIFHEAGIPPIHTPMQNLLDLPDAVKKRIHLIHVAGKTIPEGSGLRKAPDGREESIVIPVNPPPSNEALEYLDVLNHIDLFSGLPIEKAREFLTLVKVENFKKDDLIIRKHTVGDRFYMIVSGRARVERDGTIIKAYSNNDYIGETSMILNLPRNADVIAETDMKTLVMDKYDFLYFIRGSEIARHMKIIAQNREYDTWGLFDDAQLFKSLSPTQRTQLQGLMTRVRVKKGEVVAAQGTTRENFFVVDSGVMSIERTRKSILKAGRGSFLAKIYATPRRGINRFSLVAVEDAVLYLIDVMEFYRFLEKNPGVFLSLREARIRDTIQQP